MADKKQLIDADSCPCKDCLSKDYDCFARTCSDLAAWIASAVDAVEVVHGRWISLEPEIGLFECSECGHKILRAECNYCPNCGAKMDQEES